MSDYISLESGARESITLEYDQPFESEGKFGKQYTYGCKAIITGETKYTANPRVHGLIQELGVSKGDTIIIEKVKATPNDYIKVFLPENHDHKVEMDKYATGETKAVEPVDKGLANFEKQFKKPEDKLENHELSFRVERLEKIVAGLWEEYSNRTSDAGHKPGDDDIPS
tara:strand:+ start:659 stop:1165 length:507 start_codon:yes stop_codon:yes gene_type:complete